MCGGEGLGSAEGGGDEGFGVHIFQGLKAIQQGATQLRAGDQEQRVCAPVLPSYEQWDRAGH